MLDRRTMLKAAVGAVAVPGVVTETIASDGFRPGTETTRIETELLEHSQWVQFEIQLPGEDFRRTRNIGRGEHWWSVGDGWSVVSSFKENGELEICVVNLDDRSHTLLIHSVRNEHGRIF